MSTFDARAEARAIVTSLFGDPGDIVDAEDWPKCIKALGNDLQRIHAAGRTEGRDEGLRRAGEIAGGWCDHADAIVAGIERERTGTGR